MNAQTCSIEPSDHSVSISRSPRQCHLTQLKKLALMRFLAICCFETRTSTVKLLARAWGRSEAGATSIIKGRRHHIEPRTGLGRHSGRGLTLQPAREPAPRVASSPTIPEETGTLAHGHGHPSPPGLLQSADHSRTSNIPKEWRCFQRLTLNGTG